MRIWIFDDAPEELKVLSTNGGDEDWLALIPPLLKNKHIPWMEEGKSFGCCDVSEYKHKEIPGWVIRIGSHA